MQAPRALEFQAGGPLETDKAAAEDCRITNLMIDVVVGELASTTTVSRLPWHSWPWK